MIFININLDLIVIFFISVSHFTVISLQNEKQNYSGTISFLILVRLFWRAEKWILIFRRHRPANANPRNGIGSQSFTDLFVTYMSFLKTYGFPRNVRLVNRSFLSQLSSSQTPKFKNVICYTLKSDLDLNQWEISELISYPVFPE